MEQLQIAEIKVTVVFERDRMLTEEGARCLLENVKDEIYFWFEEDKVHDMHSNIKVGVLCPKN